MRKFIVVLSSLAVMFAGSYAWGYQKIFVYPEKKQTKEQQEKDEYECHKWAVDQSGEDPFEGKYPKTGGTIILHTLGGAAFGAASGAAIGAIAGNAGEGAAIGATAGGCAGAAHGVEHAQRMREQSSDASDYVRAFTACMEGKHYTVR